MCRTTAAALSSQLLSSPRKVSLSSMFRQLSGVDGGGITTRMAEQSRHAGVRFLLTRPRAQAERFCAALGARFGPVPVIISPLLETRFLTADLGLCAHAGVVFTSEAGVEGLVRLTEARDIPAWCVGQRSAQAARAAGFSVVGTAADVARLVPLLIEGGSRGALLHARGRHVAGALRDDLAKAGVLLREAVVYEQATVALSAEALAALGDDAALILPLFSPRSARLAAEACRERQAPLRVAALSPAIAEAVAALRAEVVVTSREPDEASLLDAIGRLMWLDRAP